MATSGLLMLAGCAGLSGQLSASQAADQVRSGLPLLSCHEPCLERWRAAQPQAASLAAPGQWPELAALVVNTGYQDDLTLYYLGRAAEGLGYPGAAASYYRQSTYASKTPQACRLLSGNCGGISFPSAALQRIAAIDRQLNHATRRAAPARPQLPAAAGDARSLEQAPSPAAAGNAPIPLDGAAAVLLPEDASQPTVPAPRSTTTAPTPGAPGANGADFIEPPAAPTQR